MKNSLTKSEVEFIIEQNFNYIEQRRVHVQNVESLRKQFESKFARLNNFEFSCRPFGIKWNENGNTFVAKIAKINNVCGLEITLNKL